jgi:hypothetical protein
VREKCRLRKERQNARWVYARSKVFDPLRGRGRGRGRSRVERKDRARVPCTARTGSSSDFRIRYLNIKLFLSVSQGLRSWSSGEVHSLTCSPFGAVG